MVAQKKKQDSRTHRPGAQQWAFDKGVVDVFVDMLERSIPQYHLMREQVAQLAKTFAQFDTTIVDLGCSRGDALASIQAVLGDANRYYGCEIAQAMFEVAEQRFYGQDRVLIEKLDLRTDYPDVMASVTASILTLQFVPIEYRQRVLRDIYKHTLPGGALILVEKVLGSTAEINAVMVERYHAMKAENGYSDDVILRKSLSLEGVLVPVTAAWNEELLRQAGFQQIDCFWRYMNFAGWIAIKE